MSSLLRAYIEVHRCGVAHLDPGIRNLCLLPAKEWRLQFVILDFTGAMSIPYAESHNLSWRDGEDSYLYQLYEELGEQIVLDWLDTDTAERLEKLSLMSPQELAINDPLPL